MQTKRSSPDIDVIRYVITITSLCNSYWYQFRSGVPLLPLKAACSNIVETSGFTASAVPLQRSRLRRSLAH